MWTPLVLRAPAAIIISIPMNDYPEGSGMAGRVISYLLIVLTVAIAIGSAEARQRRPVDATPFSHAPCSVLDRHPCTPSFCSVFNHGPCIPEIDYPVGQNLQLTIQSVPSASDTSKYTKPDHDLDTIGDLFAALRSCWSPPPADVSRRGMQMSVRFSFKRSGEIIGTPRVTYASAGAPSDVRTVYLNSIQNSLKACVPLKFTGGLGGAVAGRPIAIRYVDNRDFGRASGPP
jgi:hypothetical protein